jgi:hypothetical protein
MLLRRLITIACLTTGMLLLAAAPALAKGASQAQITGPGLSHPILVGGNGEPGTDSNLGNLALQGGMFDGLYGPNEVAGGPKVLVKAPEKWSLGSAYEVTYTLPWTDVSGATTNETFRQDIYPYAVGGPVIYTAPGQKVTGGSTTAGWMRGGAGLSATLTKLGIPRGEALTAPPFVNPLWIVVILGVVLVVCLTIMARRRSLKAVRSIQRV